MKTNSILPACLSYEGETVNGRLIGPIERVGRYTMYNWTCPVHGTTGKLRMKDIKARRGPQCCQLRNGHHSPSWAGHQDIPMTYINQVRRGAEVRGHEYSITPEDMWNQWTSQEGHCVYTARKITLGKDASLDRTDSSVGYTPDNIKWVHKDVNAAKQGVSHADFVKMCKEIASQYEFADDAGRL